MIDLTPLDVRNKRGDFKRILRGYDPQEVDTFLELVAERLEVLVRENIQLRERADLLQQQVSSSTGRERAVQEALVTAQELRADIRAQAQREAELVIQEAHAEARRDLDEAEHKRETLEDSLVELERRRARFLKSFRQLLERELDGVEVEEARVPLEEQAIEIHLGGGRADEDLESDAADEGRPEGSVSVEALETDVPEDDQQTESTPEPRARPEDHVPWDSPVHDLARRHLEEAEGGDAPAQPRGGVFFPLPDLPDPDDSHDTGGH